MLLKLGNRRDAATRPILLALAIVVACAAPAAASYYEEPPPTNDVYQESITPSPAPPATPSRDWLPRCAPAINPAAIFIEGRHVVVIGYVRQALVGRKLKIKLRNYFGKRGRASRDKAVATVKPRANGYFEVKAPRPRGAKLVKAARYRIESGRSKSAWVPLQRKLILQNVGYRYGVLSVTGVLRPPARSDTQITVERLDDCKRPQRIGSTGFEPGSGAIRQTVQIADLPRQTPTFIRLKARTRSISTGKPSKAQYSLMLPVVLVP